MLRTIGDACRYMTALPKPREMRQAWQHACRLILQRAPVEQITRQLSLALFMDAALDLGHSARSRLKEGVMSMWRWRKVRRANIPAELRDRLELFGEDVLAHAVGAGEHSSKGVELDGLLQQKRAEILEWLREKRDEAARHADRLETVETAILLFVICSVIIDLLLLWRGK